MGLIQAELERRGIVTASITAMPEITRQVGPPRALHVPYPLGFPLGEPRHASQQRAVLEAALALLSRRDVPLMEPLA